MVYRQILGRTRRRGSDQRILRVVVDVVDVCTSLKSQSTDRKKFTEAIGYPVKKSEVSYDKFPIGGAPGGEDEKETASSFGTGEMEELDRFLSSAAGDGAESTPTVEDDLASLYG